jgi:serine phosphatase RsbU (regulator of sigma subunit)
VLFYTDGVTEARSVGVGQFGTERLAEMFLRATLDGLSTPEIGRNLSIAVHEDDGGCGVGEVSKSFLLRGPFLVTS